MAWIAGDSFDYYGTLADVARSVWDSVVTTTSSFVLTAASRFGTGQALIKTNITGSATPWLTKNVPTNEATLFVALAYYRPGALSGTTAEGYLTFRDGATAQCTVVFESSGNMVLKSGTQTGTVLATYTAAFAQDVWTHIQMRVTISSTAGSLTVRKNGAASDSYASATTLNTRGGTTNNYANVVVLGNGASGANFSVDDVLIYSATAPAPNDWIGDVRAIALPVSGAGASSQFTASATVGQFGESGSGASTTLAANTLFWFGGPADTGPYFGRSGVLTKITITLTGAVTGSVQAALYGVDSGTGKPSGLLATSAAATNPPTGALDLTFAAGPTLSGMQRYYFALLASGTLPVSIRTGSAGNVAVYNVARTYASGFPPDGLTAGTSTVGVATILATVTDPVVAVNDYLGNGDVDYMFDATVGHEDLYAIADLPLVPAAIVGVVSKVFIKKSDAGTRNGVVRLRSGATDVQGTDTPLSSSYTYLARVDPVDPATGAPWTLAAVNAIQVGQKVTA